MVTSNLDIPACLSLLTTSKQLSLSAEARIWSDIHLTLPDHHGEHPLERPYDHGTGQYWTWAEAEARRAEVRAREDLKTKVETILCQGTRRRFDCVRSVEIENRPGGAVQMAALLTLVKNRLEKLVIRPPLKHIWDDKWNPDYPETLFAQLHLLHDGARFTLPALVALDLTFSTNIEWADSLWIMLSIARNVRELKLVVPNGRFHMHGEDDERTLIPQVDLDICGEVCLGELQSLTIDWQLDRMPFWLELALMSATELREVRLKGEFGCDPDLDRDLYDHLMGCDSLKFLSWTRRDGGALIAALSSRTSHHLSNFDGDDDDEDAEDRCFPEVETFVCSDSLALTAPRIEVGLLPDFPVGLQLILIPVHTYADHAQAVDASCELAKVSQSLAQIRGVCQYPFRSPDQYARPNLCPPSRAPNQQSTQSVSRSIYESGRGASDV